MTLPLAPHSLGRKDLCLTRFLHANRYHFARKRYEKKKAAWFPKRPFLSYGSLTLTGDLRTLTPGAYLPATS